MGATSTHGTGAGLRRKKSEMHATTVAVDLAKSERLDFFLEVNRLYRINLL